MELAVERPNESMLADPELIDYGIDCSRKISFLIVFLRVCFLNLLG